MPASEPVGPEGVSIEQTETHTSFIAETNTFASLTVTNGDWVVVQAAIINNTRDEDAIVFSGTGALADVQYMSAEWSKEAHLWYAKVTGAGTVDVTYSVTTGANSALAAYVVRCLESIHDLRVTKDALFNGQEGMIVIHVNGLQ